MLTLALLNKVSEKVCWSEIHRDDVVQETAIAYLLLDERPENMKAWVYKTMKNKLHNIVRKNRHNREGSIDRFSPLILGDTSYNPRVFDFWEAVKALSSTEQAIIKLLIKGLSQREIQLNLGLSHKLTWNNSFSAKEKLRRALR